MALDLDKFQLLLNNLNSELDERSLQSLIHICGELIPGGQRDNIKNGWDVFATLRRQNAIGDSPEKLKFLLKIMRELRPRRRDLVTMVKNYIKQNYEEAEAILNDVVESSRVESSREFSVPSWRPPWAPILVDDPHSCCICRTGCFNCGCTRCCCNWFCSCVVLTIIFLLLTAASVLIWYTNIFPEVKDYSKTPKYVGPLITFVFGFLTVSFFTLSVGYHCFQRHCRAASRTYLLGDDKTSIQAVHDTSYAQSVGTQTSSGTFPREMHRSRSSSRMTLSSSGISVAT